MNKRAKLSLFLLFVGLVLEFSPALSQSTDSTQTRPRTVTARPAQPEPAQTPTPASGSWSAQATSQATAGVAAMQNAHPLSMSKIRARTEEATRLLKARSQPTAMTGSSLFTVTLAALD